MRWLYSLHAVILTLVLMYLASLSLIHSNQTTAISTLYIMTTWFWWGMGWVAIAGDENLVEIGEDICLWCWQRAHKGYTEEQISHIWAMFCSLVKGYILSSSLFISWPCCHLIKYQRRCINIQIMYEQYTKDQCQAIHQGNCHILLLYLSLLLHRSSNELAHTVDFVWFYS